MVAKYLADIWDVFRTTFIIQISEQHLYIVIYFSITSEFYKLTLVNN